MDFENLSVLTGIVAQI